MRIPSSLVSNSCSDHDSTLASLSRSAPERKVQPCSLAALNNIFNPETFYNPLTRLPQNCLTVIAPYACLTAMQDIY